MVFLIKEVEVVDTLIRKKEVEEAITILTLVSTITMGDLILLIIQGNPLSHKGFKVLWVSLNLTGHLVKSVAKVVIHLLIVITGWTLHTKGSIHLLSWLQWLLILLKYRAAMVG